MKITERHDVFDIMEQLQLQVEARLFDQDEGNLAEMMEILGMEEDVAGKTKMQLIKIIRKEIDGKMEIDEKAAYACLEQLFAYVKGTVPPLEQAGESTEETEKKPVAKGANGEKMGSREETNKELEQRPPHPCCAEGINFWDRLASPDRQKS